MELPAPFTWYDVGKDYIANVPEECYYITFSFTIGLFVFLCAIAKSYSSASLSIIQYFLGKYEIPDQIPPAPSTTVIVKLNKNANDESRGRTRTRSPDTKASVLDEKERNIVLRRTRAITEEYKQFARSVLNILGKGITAKNKVDQIMSKIEDMSIDALIGYDKNAKVNENVVALIKKLHPDYKIETK